MEIELPHGEGCSACGACLTVCPAEAIQMKAGSDGFLYPAIQEDKCVRCGKCVRVCDLRGTEEKRLPIEAYAAVGHWDDLVQNSASGGVFASLATQLVNQGGLVAGAVMNAEEESIQVFHALTDCSAGIAPMQGSKYVQSSAWQSYQDIIRALQQGKEVLVSGTPCQISAVKRITGNPENLITADLVCHGVPSLQMLNDYVKILNKRFRGKTEQIRFRDKSKGKNFCAGINVTKGKINRQIYLRSQYMSYYQYFLKCLIYRDSCYACPYASLERVADLTIGDYWGVEKHHKELTERRDGKTKPHWSCLLVNTPKGKAFLAKYGQCLELHPSNASYIAQANQQLNEPSKKPAERAQLLELYREKGYAAIEREFIRASGGYLRYFWRLYKQIYRN